MKATGIVRRIDDLGRVVIPKEIRRTQSIRQGDPLEIFISDAGELLLKKHSSLGTFFEFTNRYINVLAKELGKTVIVCDTQTITAVAGSGKKELIGARINSPLEQIIEQRKEFIYDINSPLLYPCDNSLQFLLLAKPILASGDVIGVIALLSNAKGTSANKEERLAFNIATSFFAKEFEG